MSEYLGDVKRTIEPPCLPRPLSGSGVVVAAEDAAGLVYLGYSVRETGGSARVTIDIYHGADAEGELIDTLSLSAGESRSDRPPSGVPCKNGIFVAVAGSGTISGVVYTRGGA